MRRLAAMAAIASITAMAVWMLLGVPGFAEERDAGKKEQEAAETSEVKPGKKTGQDDSRKKKGPGWPRPFKPTEEISADSTVPFPTDI